MRAPIRSAERSCGPSAWASSTATTGSLIWQNFLSVDPASEPSADVLIAKAERVFADLPIRHVLLADAHAAEGLRPGGGYQEAVLVTMLWRQPPDREPPTADLVELGASELGPAVEAYVRGDSHAEESARARELCLLKEELGRNGVRFLAALVEEEIAGWCEVRRYEAAGQVEDVVVLEPFRGRGLARALTCEAVERLRGDRCDSIFVVADDKDTVKDLYRRLGFDDVRRTWSFWWPGP